MKTLEERIAALEKANRRWRLGAAILALIAIVAAAGATLIGFAAIGIASAAHSGVSDVLRTRSLEVLDSSNAVVAAINSDVSNGRHRGAEFNLYAPDGNRHFGVFTADRIGFLTLTGENGQTTITGGQLSIYAESEDLSDQHRRVQLGVGKRDTGWVQVNNRDGNPAVTLGADESGGNVMVATDEGGAALTATCSERGAQLNVYGRKHKAVILDANERNGGMVITLQKTGEPGVSLVNPP